MGVERHRWPTAACGDPYRPARGVRLGLQLGEGARQLLGGAPLALQIPFSLVQLHEAPTGVKQEIEQIV